MGFEEFIITEEKLDTGLRGFPIGYCTTSQVIPDKGLYYMGKPVHEVASLAPEEVIFLLYHGRFAEGDELAALQQELQKRAHLNPKVAEAIYALPREGSAMGLLSCALTLTGMFESKKNYQEDCLDLIALIPVIVAHVINHHAGFGKTPESRPELGYMENFAAMLQVPNKDQKALSEVFRLFNVLHFDHGGGNLSTFVGKAVASGLEDLYGSLSSAMHALAGPRHGKANQDCLVFVQEVVEKLGHGLTEESLEDLLRAKLDNKELVFGFGHAVLRVEDTRATVLYELAEKNYRDHPYVKAALLLRKVGPKVLKENPKIQNPYPNVDGISGTVLTAAGFAYPEYFTVLFGLSRCVGIAIQILHERTEARDGKGVPIYRPKYLFQQRD